MHWFEQGPRRTANNGIKIENNKIHDRTKLEEIWSYNCPQQRKKTTNRLYFHQQWYRW